MNENQLTVMSLVMVQLQKINIVTEEQIKMLVDTFSLINPIGQNEKEEVIRELHSKLSIRMDRGAVVRDTGHVSWYYSRKSGIIGSFWSRYRTFLITELGFNNSVVNSLDASTDEMMDLIGDPMSSKSYSRRGLVIGDVQSGKTATYTALINKAGDAGYRIIILLTGTIEKLRQQTQGRLDEGFIGLDSTAFNLNKDEILVGVGNIDPSISAWAVTSTSSDFNKSTASKLSGKLKDISTPVVFVLKKNKSVLEKLEQWLRMFNAHPTEGRIDLPMLLIDDEADNASVNTSDEENPTIINANIRKILKLFVKANYVGFTATPFANIFINPDSTQEMLEDDLFPRDFIYALEPPSNYIGARDIFSDEGSFNFMLKENDDCEKYIPIKHKKDFEIESLPKSLREAIVSFFIANAIRDLRGHGKKHRSMLINVSRFINVQGSINRTVDSFVRDYQRIVKNYYLSKNAMEYEEFQFIKYVYDKHFSKSDYNWDRIQSSLNEAVASIVVRTVNSGNASKNLNYDESEEEGLRIIAVGGLSLSRGLTLEGLMISYFYRNSKMYDTLMQMGRWFGYRDKYSDLCQVWMSEDAIDWYSYISVAADELRKEVRRMQAENKTPKDFGLCVRSDVNTLLVTARNKMKTAKDYEMIVSLNGKMIETPFLHNNKDIVEYNRKLTEDFLKRLFDNRFVVSTNENLSVSHPQITDIPKRMIIDFLKEFKSHDLNMDFRPDDLIDFIKSYEDNSLDYWDLVIAQGDGRVSKITDLEIKSVLRKFDIRANARGLQLSGTKSRLGSTTFAKAGLTKSQVEEIERPEKRRQVELGKKWSISQEIYFNSGIKRNPLLAIYPVELKPVIKRIENDETVEVVSEIKQSILMNLGFPIIGLSIGIPRIDSSVAKKTMQYKINMVKYRELFDIVDDDELYEEDAIEQ
jgi:hypothetical protein